MFAVGSVVIYGQSRRLVCATLHPELAHQTDELNRGFVIGSMGFRNLTRLGQLMNENGPEKALTSVFSASVTSTCEVAVVKSEEVGSLVQHPTVINTRMARAGPAQPVGVYSDDQHFRLVLPYQFFRARLFLEIW